MATATAKKEPYGDVAYADPGYQADKKKRYPIDNRTHAKAAWSYVNQADNARLYTSAQLKRIKQRITKALKAFGVTVATAEGWLIDPATAVTEALAECWDMDSGPAGNLYISLTNGPTTVTVSSSLLDTHDLGIVGRAAMAGACDALLQLDPDMDADIDVPGAPGEDTDDDMGSGDGTATAAGAPCPCGCGCAVPETPGNCPCACTAGECLHCMGEDDDSGGDDAMESIPYVAAGTQPTARHWQLLQESGLLTPGVTVTATLVNEAIDAHRAALAAPTETPAPETPAAANPTQEEEPAMAESTTPAAETAAAPAAGGVHLTDDQFKTLLAAVTPAAAPAAATESAPAAPVAEAAPAAPAVTETDDQRIARLVAEGIAAAMPQAIQEHVERQGPPTRKGLAVPVTEHTAPTGQGGLNGQGVPSDWPDKPLHTYTDEERAQHFGPALEQHVFGGRTRG
ncbi:DUF6582 domain-containing protein [Streptomyces sp. NPDC020794]|uniref:DUF6582 domain-containing protein n=1 Tax=unclassified Streptomyces TaxID=2593676 RepID=UPI0036E6FEFF